MGRLDVHIRHGGGSIGHLALTGAVIGVIGAAGGASGALSDLSAALIWLAGTLAVVIAGLSVLLIRAMRRGWRPDYVRSMHGPTDRDRQLDENARLREEIRAMRTREEMEAFLGTPITSWQARILDQMLQEGHPRPFVTGRSGLCQQLPPIPGHEG